MMKLLILIPIFLILVGCGDPTPSERTLIKSVYICDDSTITDRSSFTIQCIANANPKSDEEPEDCIRICMTMSTALQCRKEAQPVKQQTPSGACGWEDM